MVVHLQEIISVAAKGIWRFLIQWWVVTFLIGTTMLFRNRLNSCLSWSFANQISQWFVKSTSFWLSGHRQSKSKSWNKNITWVTASPALDRDPVFHWDLLQRVSSSHIFPSIVKLLTSTTLVHQALFIASNFIFRSKFQSLTNCFHKIAPKDLRVTRSTTPQSQQWSHWFHVMC